MRLETTYLEMKDCYKVDSVSGKTTIATMEIKDGIGIVTFVRQDINIKTLTKAIEDLNECTALKWG